MTPDVGPGDSGEPIQIPPEALEGVILDVDDVMVDSAHPLPLLLRSRFHANQRVTVSYSRGNTSTQVQLTLVGVHPTC